MKNHKRYTIAFLGLIFVVTGFISYSFIASGSKIVLDPNHSVNSLPGNFNKIQIGMKQDKVIALVGEPVNKSMNEKFVHKTRQEWQQLQQEVDNLSQKNVETETAPSPRILKLGAELQHRTKEIWRYRPDQRLNVVLSFDENGILLGIGSVRVKSQST